MSSFDYNKSAFVKALKKLNLKRGDVIFSHSNIGFFGIPQEGRNIDIIFDLIYSSFIEVIGEEGTLCVPTFTYSFCKGEKFDMDNSPSTCGIFTELLRKLPNAYRSEDPIFSICAVGKKARELTRDISDECFGEDSFWDRFLKNDGVICNLNFDAGSTFIHYVEKVLNVPYRYDKLFTGTIVRKGKEEKKAVVYFVRDMSNPDTEPIFEPFSQLVLKKGIARKVEVGRGSIVSIRAKDVLKFLKDELKRKPSLLIKGYFKKKKSVLIKKDIINRFNVKLDKDASMKEIIDSLWFIPRDIISDGFDISLHALSNILPMNIYRYPTGTKCWTWIIPEKWRCKKAYIKTTQGKELLSYNTNPLHVVSYSLPYKGIVKREDLLQHIYTHPKNRKAIPFVFKYYERDWGFCCSQEFKESLNDEEYEVVIDTEFSYGALQVGEVVLEGRSEDSIILCSHLCHPCMANDGLSGVAVGIELMRRLMKFTDRYYTYRLLILPETIGSIAWLSHNEHLIPKMRGGIFLEMLGLELPYILQLSFYGNTEIDKVFSNTLRYSGFEYKIVKYRESIGNDERQFNSPGVRVPMVSIARTYLPGDERWPYPEYHSSFDTSDIISEKSLYESCDLILKVINNLENNYYVVNKYKGEIFLSRFALEFSNNMKVRYIMDLIDGNRTIVDIADACGLSFEECKRIIDIFKQKKLVEYTREKIA